MTIFISESRAHMIPFNDLVVASVVAYPKKNGTWVILKSRYLKQPKCPVTFKTLIKHIEAAL